MFRYGAHYHEGQKIQLMVEAFSLSKKDNSCIIFSIR